MNLEKEITVDHVRQALEIIKDGGKDYNGQRVNYSQPNFCGTACCLWGHASIVAGRYTAEEIYKSEYYGLTHDELSRHLGEWEDSEDELKVELADAMDHPVFTPEHFQAIFDEHDTPF